MYAPDDPLLNTEELAQLYRVKPNTISKWCMKNRAPWPVVRIGRRRLVRRSDALRFIEARTTSTAA